MVNKSIDKSQKRDPKTNLNFRQSSFVYEYMENGGNGTAAAKFAGYAKPAETSSRLLRNVNIQKILKEAVGRKAMSAEEVLERLGEQARVDISAFVRKQVILGADGVEACILSLNWDEIKKRGHLIKSITATAHGPKLELHDGQTALIHLGKHHRLFVDRVDVTSKDKPIKGYIGISPADWTAKEAKKNDEPEEATTE